MLTTHLIALCSHATGVLSRVRFSRAPRGSLRGDQRLGLLLRSLPTMSWEDSSFAQPSEFQSLLGSEGACAETAFDQLCDFGIVPSAPRAPIPTERGGYCSLPAPKTRGLACAMDIL